jgi:hypothetical protein
MKKKIPIARNLSDRESRDWWAAMDAIARRVPRLSTEQKPFPRSASANASRKPSGSRSRTAR